MYTFCLCLVIVYLVGCSSGQRGPICYNCTGVNDAIDCDAVQRCSSGQVCFVERDPTNSWNRNLGCRDAKLCHNVKEGNACTTCCQGDLCNGKGCGVREIPQPHGPACYNCPEEETPQGCTHIKHCLVGEVCTISRDKLGRNVTYDTNCASKYFCPSTVPAVIGRRASLFELSGKRGGATTECLKCCNTDLCNDMECPSIYTKQSTAVPKTTPSNPTTKHVSTSPVPVAGTLSQWSSWTRCPFSCGRDGIQHRFRHCTSPSSHTGGQTCIGSRIDTKFCHNPPCCNGPPVITFIESDARVNVGDFVRLRCNATHADILYWEGPKIVGQKFPENVEVISGRNLLVVNHIAYNNTGDYRCIAKNLCGITTKYVNVDIIN